MSDNHTHRTLEPLDAQAYANCRNNQQQGPAPATLARWFESLGALHRWTADRDEFFAEAAQFVVDPIGLDQGIVLRKNALSSGPRWQIVASHSATTKTIAPCDLRLIDQAADARETLFHSAPGETESIVISPLFDAKDQVTGAIYGTRVIHGSNGRRGIRYLEAQLVELLAQSVSTGIARLEHEAKAARRRVTYEQVFAPGIAQQMELGPRILRGEDREVTVLFADLRDFSKLCTQLSTSEAYELLNDVMDALTAAVMENDGVLIDYYGDGLSAMWNAPVTQPNHPELACNAGLAMLEALPAVSEQWRSLLAEPLRIGVGIHTGPAKVGNIGSTQKLKYGPRGSTVNLASRLESATKLVGTPLVVTRAVADRLTAPFFRFRVCQANLSGVEEPVDLFGVRRATTEAHWIEAVERYEKALELYESGELAKACALLANESEATEQDNQELPTDFLARQIQLDCSRRLGRRACDEPSKTHTPAIDLAVK